MGRVSYKPENILLHFGDAPRIARKRYRPFAKNGMDQGKRSELQGGGLVRSSGVNKAAFLAGRIKDVKWEMNGFLAVVIL